MSKNNASEFRPNDFVVYPAHGVGQIVSIEEQPYSTTTIGQTTDQTIWAAASVSIARLDYGQESPELKSMIAELDRKLSEQVNLILHHEDFQKLEGAWRGLRAHVEHHPEALFALRGAHAQDRPFAGDLAREARAVDAREIDDDACRIVEGEDLVRGGLAEFEHHPGSFRRVPQAQVAQLARRCRGRCDR